MEKEEIDFIKNWFYSDFNIEIEIINGKQKGLIILENNAYYFEGKRFEGDKRRIIYDSENENDKIYDFLERNFKEYFYSEYSLNEILEFLKYLETNRFKLKVI